MIVLMKKGRVCSPYSLLNLLFCHADTNPQLIHVCKVHKPLVAEAHAGNKRNFVCF